MKKVKSLVVLMAAVVLLKMVKVKRSAFTLLLPADDVRAYIDDCVAMGSAALLYANPAITTAFYAAGTVASGNITAAIKVHNLAPTTGNLDALDVRRTEGIAWLESYATQVETIANMDANRATRDAAFANIGLSYLTPQKLVNSTKGVPETPIITGEITGAKTCKVEVTNGDTYNPSQTNFVMVELPKYTTEETPDPIVALKEGQITVSGGTGDVITKSLSGKGKSTTLKFNNGGKRYAVYAYAQNGKKLVSDLSAKIIVES